MPRIEAIIYAMRNAGIPRDGIDEARKAWVKYLTPNELRAWDICVSATAK